MARAKFGKLCRRWLSNPGIIHPYQKIPKSGSLVIFQGKSRMRSFCKYGSVLGAASNGYHDSPTFLLAHCVPGDPSASIAA